MNIKHKFMKNKNKNDISNYLVFGNLSSFDTEASRHEVSFTFDTNNIDSNINNKKNINTNVIIKSMNKM